MKQNHTPKQLPVPNTVRHHEPTGDEQIKVITLEDNVKYGEAGHHRDAGHMATVVKKGNNSTNS